MITAVIPREGFMERLEGLREQRREIEIRISEIEHWLAILDALEAAPVEEPKKKRKT